MGLDRSGAAVQDRPEVRHGRTAGNLATTTYALQQTIGPVAIGSGGVWVADAVGLASRFDPAGGRVADRVGVGQGAGAIALGAGAVWVANADDGTVSRIDLAGSVTTIPVGHAPAGVAVGFGAVWVTNATDRTLVRIDPASNAIVAAIRAGERPTGVAFAGNSVWVADSGSGALLRFDPRSNRLVQTIPLGGSPRGLAVGGGKVWVSVTPPSRPVPAPTDDVIRLEGAEDPGNLDPASQATGADPQLAHAACAGLMRYPDRPTAVGYRLVPEIAQSAPSVSSDGRRYTFIIRAGYRFSPPSGAPVTAQAFKYSIERALSPRLPVASVAPLQDVVGLAAYTSGRAADIAGVIAHGDELTVVLRRPAGDLPARLSAHYFCPVPIGTPVSPRPGSTIPSAGPYYVTSYTPGQQLLLRRNPGYAGPRPGRAKEIAVTLGVGQAQALADVESGHADYTLNGVPLDHDAELRARYGADSPAARAGRQRYFVNPAATLRMLQLNTARPVFADVRVRRAAAYAIDRRALAAQQQRFFSAGELGGGPAAEGYLPSVIPGAPTRQVYPVSGPDLRRARALAGHQHRTAVLYTCDQAPCPQQAAILRSNLRAIGIDLRVEALPKPQVYGLASLRGAPYDLVSTGWGADYGDPDEFLNTLLDGSLIGPKDNTNLSYFNDPGYNQRLRAAARLGGAARYRAYARLALDLEAKSSPLLVYASDASHDFFAARIGCQSYQPLYGIDLGALCVVTHP